MKPLKILYSAYACEPNKGSEPGTGWRWVLESARLGHEIRVITRENNAAGIELGLAAVAPGLDIKFHYYDLPPWFRWWKKGARGVHLYYCVWQWGAYRMARRLQAAHHFDAVHHITFGVTRHASFMGRLGLPLVLGPLGGGERAPMRLRRHFSWRSFLHDGARDLANACSRVGPFVRAMFTKADLILCRTPQTLRSLPKRSQPRARCMLEIGNDPRPDNDCPPQALDAQAQPLRLVYVGRFLYLKGMGLGLRSVALLRARGVDVNLTMIGQGPEHARWLSLAHKLGIAEHVRWVPWMRQPDLLRAYATFDAMLFPSLRDSGGNVVLEALSGWLPVVCLGLGGPAELVNSSCGRVVQAEGRSESEVVEGMADALAELAADRSLLARLRRGASARAAENTWHKVVSRVWGPDGMGCRMVAASRAGNRSGVTRRDTSEPGFQVPGGR